MYPSTKASISNADGSNETEAKAVLQGTLYVMFQYVRPAKVLAALQWLKLNNPLYKDIKINDDWTGNARQDDADLWEAVSAEQCPPPSASSQMFTDLQLNGK